MQKKKGAIKFTSSINKIPYLTALRFWRIYKDTESKLTKTGSRFSIIVQDTLREKIRLDTGKYDYELANTVSTETGVLVGAR
jgi:hypothetical protein